MTVAADNGSAAGNPRAPSEVVRVAWPTRALNYLLGPPTKSGARTDGTLRYRACEKCARSIGPVNVVANTFLMIIKAYLGVVGRSTALVADAIHSAADVVSSIMLLFGLKMARKPSDGKYPYGYGKVEFLVAVVIYSSLILAGVVIFIDAITCIIHGECVSPSLVAAFGALLSVVVNEMMFRQSACAGAQLKSPSIVANAWEKRGDALSSLAVFVGILGAKMGLHCLDPAAAILVAVYILKSSAEGIIEAFKGLMDSALEPEMVEAIHASAQGVQGVMGIEALRTREVGQVAWVDLEILVDGDSLVEGTNLIKDAVKSAVSSELGRNANIEVYLKPAPGKGGLG